MMYDGWSNESDSIDSRLELKLIQEYNKLDNPLYSQEYYIASEIAKLKNQEIMLLKSEVDKSTAEVIMYISNFYPLIYKQYILESKDANSAYENVMQHIFFNFKKYDKEIIKSHLRKYRLYDSRDLSKIKFIYLLFISIAFIYLIYYLSTNIDPELVGLMPLICVTYVLSHKLSNSKMLIKKPKE